MLYKEVLIFGPKDELLKCDLSMKATEQYFPVVLFIMLYKVVLRFETVNETLTCHQSHSLRCY